MRALFVLLAASFVVAGCSKNEPETAPPPADTTATAPGTTTEPAPTPPPTEDSTTAVPGSEPPPVDTPPSEPTPTP